MSLNPRRLETHGPRLLGFPDPDGTIRAASEGILGEYRTARSGILEEVRRGDLTPKVARERVAGLASQARAMLAERVGAASRPASPLRDRLLAMRQAGRSRPDADSLEALQRETNRLLRLNLIEQQLQTRASEFEARTHVRPIGGGSAAPTLDGLLAFHDQATSEGDEAAREWGRRQLEAFRPRLGSDEDVRRVDLATRRPDRSNPRIVEAFLEALRSADDAMLDGFVAEAIAERDADACAAAYILAREQPEGTTSPWVRRLADGLSRFPDATVATLAEYESRRGEAESEIAREAIDAAWMQVDGDERIGDRDAPTDADLARSKRIASRPLAAPGEAIGLALDRRGALRPEEFARLEPAGESDADAVDAPIES